MIEGTKAGDRLIGGNADDDIDGFNGDDKLIGQSRDEWVYPGEFGQKVAQAKMGSGDDIIFTDQKGWL